METEMQRETWFEETVMPSCLNSRLRTPAPEMTFIAASRATSVTQELPPSPAGCSAGSGTGRRLAFAWFCLSSRRHTVDLGFTSTVIRGPVQPPPTGPCLPTSLRSTVWGCAPPSLCWGSPRLFPRTAQGPNIWLMVKETCQNPLGEAADP